MFTGYYASEIHESEQVCTFDKRLHAILDARYKKEDLNKVTKNQCHHFIIDFRKINKQLKRKPYPMPKINEMILKLEGF